MNKFILILVLFLLAGCEVGKFTPERNKLYDHGKDICQTNPSRCINNYPW